MSRVVLDTSTVLALCFAEKGAKATITRVQNAIISAVNHSEIIAKSLDYGVPIETIRQAMAGMTLNIIPFDEEHAFAAASLRPATRNSDISFADRACLATAALAALPVLTANKDWRKLDLGIEVILIR